MILDREVYFPNPIYKRILLFFKKFLYILFRFLGRPNWGRLKSGQKLSTEKNDLVLTINDDGSLRCTSCELCVQVCPTSCLQVVPPPGLSAPSAPSLFHFEPLKCIMCNLCEDICPEGAIAFIPEGSMAGQFEDDWARDLQYLAYRNSLNDGKGLTVSDVLNLRSQLKVAK
ncbi:MAG: 4Fe-4S binding protein [Bacteriovoracaceae bacterium]|nr:4Fe-4S binding protein [Bacteriovoracaceae bacterium]